MAMNIIDEVLSGETLVSPGGLVDAVTTWPKDDRVWGDLSNAQLQEAVDLLDEAASRRLADLAAATPN